MARVEADPEDLERLESQYALYVENIRSLLSTLQGEFEETDWDDPRYREARDEFDNLVTSCENQLAIMEDYQLSVLRKYIEMLREMT